jgi:hypothetical protein
MLKKCNGFQTRMILDPVLSCNLFCLPVSL